ncbi:MAG: glycosyltransferase family 2 protein [Beduini sp.]|uniref:glycosyltransferase family 2 protein n=1 Tax=Beduini sp. TaxID=1922300 RepID=UPI0011CCCE94
MKKKVSIILPVYNAKVEHIQLAINSTCNQTYVNKEIIVIDDGSNDFVAHMLDCYQEKYDYIKVFHKNNEGVSIARNKGIELSSGDYLFFMDSDDYLEPDTIEKLICIQSEHNSDITGCLYYIFDEKVKKSLYSGPPVQIYDTHNMDNYRLLMFAPTFQKHTYYPYCMCVWGKLIKKSTVVENRITFNEQLCFSEDLLFLNKISYCVEKIVIVSDELYGYRISNHSVTHKFSYDYHKKIIDMLSIIEKELDLSNENIKRFFDIYKLLFLINITKFYIVNKENRLDYQSKRKRLKDICYFFDLKQVKRCSILPLKYKLFLYSLKYKFFDLAYILALLSTK